MNNTRLTIRDQNLCKVWRAEIWSADLDDHKTYGNDTPLRVSVINWSDLSYSECIERFEDKREQGIEMHNCHLAGSTRFQRNRFHDDCDGSLFANASSFAWRRMLSTSANRDVIVNLNGTV